MEPTRPGELHLSTLLHQVLALIGQHGGVSPAAAFKRLVGSGTFAEVTPELFKRLLRRMDEPEVGLLEQAPDGTLLPGHEGERLLGSYEFFAVFKTPKEYRVVHGGKSLGTLPVEFAPVPGEQILFAGRRWKVEAVDPRRREVAVTPARHGKAPRFGGEATAPHDAVVAEMRRLYGETGTPAYVDTGAQALLAEGRETYARLRLGVEQLVSYGSEVLLFPWAGGRKQMALCLAPVAQGLEVAPTSLALTAEDHVADVRRALEAIARAPDPDPIALAATVPDRCLDKFDVYLNEEQQTSVFASRRLEPGGLAALAAQILRSGA
jgi:ATP-dependent Lhr-like helicase